MGYKRQRTKQYHTKTRTATARPPRLVLARSLAALLTGWEGDRVGAVEVSDPVIDTPKAFEVAREGVGLEFSARCRGVVLVFGPPGDLVGSPEIRDSGASASADESISEVKG